MKPKRILLVRHGESIANKDKTHYSYMQDYNVNLTMNGIKQSLFVGKTINHDLDISKIGVYLSPYKRTKETYKYIKAHIENKIIFEYEDPRIREQDWGHWREAPDIKKFNEERERYGKFYYRLPDGESGADVFNRTCLFINTLYRHFNRENYPETILIVSHGIFIKVFLMNWFHWTVDQYNDYKPPKNCEILKLELNKKNKYDLKTPLRIHKNHPDS